MPNRSYAFEWMDLADRHFATARLLIREKHFTDSIAIEIHQALELSFKALWAYYGERIPKTHSLPLLFSFVNEKIDLDVNAGDLITISDYYETERYPGPRYSKPSREEVESYFILVERLMIHIKGYLNS
jgi:HEPN domain-containing protein